MPERGWETLVTMFTGIELSMVLCSYLLGCCTAGYYWMRLRTGQDVRRLGSGNVGARNVGRTLGTSGFAVTFVFDFLKGALVVWLAQWMDLRPEATIACMLAAVVGHAWPVQLRFQGGKGISTAGGAILCYSPGVALVLICLFVPIYLMMRVFTLSGMLVFVLSPLVAFLCGFSNPEVAANSFLSMLLLVTHQKNIREEIGRRLPKKAAGETPGNQDSSEHER